MVIDGLAAYRITRLIVTDSFPPVANAREKIIEWGIQPKHRVRNKQTGKVTGHPLAELITCPWCTGFWVAVAVTGSRLLWPRWWQPVATAFSLSAAAGLISELEGKL